MIRHFFIHFLRTLRRHKLFSFINLLGLTVSIVCTLLIYLYVRHEFSYDRFHKNPGRIYRVNQTFIWGENDSHQFSSTGPGVAYAVREEIPEIELITSIHTPGDFIVSYTTPTNEVITFEENKILAADTNFFRMFNFPLVKGEETTVLRNANTLVMTESTARKYFGDADPVGKLVNLGGASVNKNETYEVTGVVKDAPDNSYIRFNVLLSMKGFPVEQKYWSWVWTQLETYVLLSPNADIEKVRARLVDIPRKHAEQTLQWTMNTTFDEYTKSGKKWELFLQPLTSIHLPTEPVYNRLNDPGNIKIIYSLIGAAVVIVLLSCVNFMNLSTAQFTRRLKEASLRKILGLGKRELSAGYFYEAIAFCLIALAGALAITYWLLPAFNRAIGITLRIDLFGDLNLVIALSALVLMMAVISSIYPALYLSGFNPVEAIKGKIKTGRQGTSFRNGLVVFQFTVSIILMISTVIVFQQLNYVSEKDLGFNKENLLVLRHVEALKNGQSIAAAAKNVPGVLEVSWCTSLPPTIWGGDTFSAEGMNGKTFSLNYTSADAAFLPALVIPLQYGRNFVDQSPADIDKVILNETAVKKIGWKLDESVIGRTLKYPNSDDATFEVVGVVKDFHYWSLESAIEPMAIFHINNSKVASNSKQYLAIRIQPQNSGAWENTFASLNDIWKEAARDIPFEYTFVDEVFAQTFQTQQRLGRVLTVLAVLAMLIAGLGLLGMIIYALEQRMKEIGIRKVSGASVGAILLLVTKGYTKLIVIAFLIASPLAYWLIHEWLKDFAYRITPSPTVFVLTGLATLLIAILITGYHSMRAAMMNPVDVLRDE